jgi:hypothetical protein
MSATSSLTIQPRATSQEIASSASAALAKATIEAKFVIALQRPRSILTARASILDACKRPAFAEGAMYRKKQGRKQEGARWVDNYVEGLSIRFAEQALNAWRNVDVSAVTAWEDENARLVRITVTDLETNLSYSDEVMLAKTVERRSVREGQEVLGERETSDGNKVFIVRTTDEEMANKVNAAKSKAIRNSGLRLIPQDILEEAESAIRETREKGGGDPRAQVKKLTDAFGGIGVPPTELEAHLGHPLEQTSPKELADLRAIYTAIRDGEARWADYRTLSNVGGQNSDDDQIPGVEVPPRPRNSAPSDSGAPETRGPGSAEAGSPAASAAPNSDATPQQRLADLLDREGIKFEDFVRWGVQTGNLADPSSLGAYADIAPTVASRLLRASKGLVNQIKAMKGGAK